MPQTPSRTLKELHVSLRPRERLAAEGVDALHHDELVAIALGTGSSGENVLDLARRLLTEFHGLQGLAHATLRELCTVKGIGPAKAAQLLAALRLGRMLAAAEARDLPQITGGADAARYFSALLVDARQEEVHVMLLDTKHHVIRIEALYRGSLDSATVRVAEVFRDAIRDNAAAIILAHNHPSGDPEPSPEDLSLTADIARAGRLLGVKVLDHLIIGRGHFVSLRQRSPGLEWE